MAVTVRRLAKAAVLALLVTAPAWAQQQAVSPPSSQPAAPDSPQPLKPADAFGKDVTLPERQVIYIRGHARWDTAFETLLDAFASLTAYIDKQGVKTSGKPMTIYQQTDDSGFDFWAAYPIAEAPKDPPKGDIAVGAAPSGRALEFTHRGTYEALDTTYEAITNYLDSKQLDAKDNFIEEYASGPLKPGDSDVVVNIYVPVK
jgi:effector-binding domain-containing protein